MNQRNVPNSFRLLEELRLELEKTSQVSLLEESNLSLQTDKIRLEQRVMELEQRLTSKNSQAAVALEEMKQALRSQLSSLDHQIQSLSLSNPTPAPAPRPQIQMPVQPQHYGLAPEPVLSRRELKKQAKEERKRQEAQLKEMEKIQAMQRASMAQPAAVAMELPKVTVPKLKKPRSVKRVIRRTLTVSLAACLLYAGWNFIKPSSEIGTVAGVTASTPTPTPAASMNAYTESYAELPLDQTTWDSHIDQEFKLRLDYPKNTSNRVRTVGGSNIWFLRKNGYLMKITQLTSDTTITLDQWWNTNGTNFSDLGAPTKTTFKGVPAMFVDTKEKTVTSGSSYFVKRPTGVYQIWIKDEPAITDDGQRIKRMVDSLAFTD